MTVEVIFSLTGGEEEVNLDKLLSLFGLGNTCLLPAGEVSAGGRGSWAELRQTIYDMVLSYKEY